MKTLLIIDDDNSNWYEFLEGTSSTNGEELHIEQSMWDQMSLTSYSDSGVVINVQASPNAFEGTTQTKSRILRPDFILIRNVIRGAQPDHDYRNLLYGLKFANIPCINSLDSVLLCSERPCVFGELLKIQKRLGREKFPLIDQTYYSHSNEMIITPQYPIVVKIGHAHAGYGKLRFENHHDFEDFSSVMALYKDYITAEPFIDSKYDLRIQKIGKTYAAYKRIATGWKGNMATAIIEDIPLNDSYKLWVDECSKIFGGLDICAIDAVHGKDGKEYIIELNDSAIGLAPHRKEEDMNSLRDLIIQKLI